MINGNKLWAVIPAAGSGRRMGSTIPKQYLALADSCVLDITLQAVLGEPAVDGVFVALASDDDHFAGCQHASAVVAIAGGSDRARSVLNVLDYLIDRFSPEDWVLVHDAARPCVRADKLRQLVDTASQRNCGAILATPVVNTLKHVEHQRVATTVDRSHLWQAHTPQIFRLGELHHAIQQGLQQNLDITDEASAMEYIGKPPLIVSDSRDNIKITEADDLALAACILAAQKARYK